MNFLIQTPCKLLAIKINFKFQFWFLFNFGLHSPCSGIQNLGQKFGFSSAQFCRLKFV